MEFHKQKGLSDSQIYCFDTSAIINLFRHGGVNYPPYPQDIFKGLWEKIDDLVSQNKIISHYTVWEELKDKDDDVKKWCEVRKKIFKETQESHKQKIKDVKRYYNNNYWSNQEKRTNEWADPWVIVLALCEAAIIVTDEGKPDKKDTIPYVAEKLNITTINLVEFFRKVGLKLISI